jgi:hypothetical protein
MTANFGNAHCWDTDILVNDIESKQMQKTKKERLTILIEEINSESILEE